MEKKDPKYQILLESLSFEDIQKQAQDARLVYLAATPSGGVALIVRCEGETEVVQLPSLTEKALLEQVQGSDDDPNLGGYLGAYAVWRTNTTDQAAHQNWISILDKTTQWLWDSAMAPIVEALQGEEAIASFRPVSVLVAVACGLA